MNLLSFIPLLIPTLDCSCELENLYNDYGHYLNINDKLFAANLEAQQIKHYDLFNFKVDSESGNGLFIYVFKGVPFASMETVHEDSLNYSIINYPIFYEVLKILLSCIEKVEKEVGTENETNNESLLNLKNFPVIQGFASTYNVYGRNLIYLEDDNTFSLIEKYWQDKEEIKKDNDRSYSESYYYNFFEIIVNGVQKRVNYSRILGVIGDNKVIADSLVKDPKAFNITNFFEYCNIKQLKGNDD